MSIFRTLRPTFAGASALLIGACSGGYHTDTQPRTVQPAGAQTSELKKIADQLAHSGDHSAAIPIYRHLASQDGNPAALDALAFSLLAQGLQNEALPILNLLTERGQASTETWYNLGKIGLARGHYDESLQQFSHALALDSHNIRAMSGQAIALAALGRTAEALAVLQGQTDSQSISNHGLILTASGNPAAAITLLEPFINKGDGSARDRQNLAIAYLLAGQEAPAYQIARLDLDAASTHETFTFYRSLGSLGSAERMQALITGTIKPEWSRTEMANLQLQETAEKTAAAQRLTDHMTVASSAVAKAPAPVQNPEETVSHATYELTEVPPLLEPEGWALQIGAYRSIKHLMRGWTLLYRQSGDLLKDTPPRRSEVNFAENPGRPSGFYYRLNAGPLKSLQAARDLCEKLQERGTSCWIRPPEATEGQLPESTEATAS